MMRAFPLIPTLLLTTTLAVPALAQEGAVAIETAPGTARATAAITASGTITGVDAQTRTITIEGDGGTVVSLIAGPDVRNFDQLAVGQRVDAEYVRTLTLELKPGSTAPIARMVDEALAGAREGAPPAGMVGRRVTVVAEVVGLDAENHTVTLRGPERTVALEVAPEQFARVNLGDRVEAVYLEAAALSVRPAE
jgi:hypothetical protein